MAKKYDFDYIVIGSGPAGSAAAFGLVKAKKRIAIIEGHHYGGTNLNTYDVPYSVALDFSHTYSKILSYPEFKHQDFTFSFPTTVAKELKATINTHGNSEAPFKESSIVCLNGYANFLDKHTIAVGTQKFTAEHFIIATGSHLKIGDIVGTESVNYLTPATAIKLRRLPQAVFIVGGGSTGCEIASYYAELGAKVIIAESSSRLLPREDKEVSSLLTDYFTKHLGIMVLPNSKVVTLAQDDFSKCVIFRNARTEKMVRVDCVVLATGSEPNLNHGLENAGVKYKPTGITVNRYFETSTKNIYAIGDCIGGESSTDRSDYEGSLLAANIVNKTRNPANYSGFIRSTNTFPEVATVGLNETDLTKLKRKYKKALIRLDTTTASKIFDFNYGFIKIISDMSGHIIGATIVAPHASIMAAEFALAIRHNLTAVQLASTPRIVNDYGYAIKLAAKKLAKK